MTNPNFTKSDIGAQSAWKGFSSQTLYIAHRLLSDDGAYEYYPEDIEDLVVKKNGVILEAVQVKNSKADMSLSKLASTHTSKGGEGFFNRMCSIHKSDDSFSCITIVYFGDLGQEFKEIRDNVIATKKKLVKRLVDNHNLSEDDATWLINSLKFEKANIEELEKNIESQINSYVPTMSAPDLAKDLLVQYISNLSKVKGFTTLEIWKEKIHSIGVSISTIDGFYKEYNKSLVRLSELKLNDNCEELKNEFSQGVSVHPTHIRYGFDFKRNYWLEKIRNAIESKGVVVVKGVSGQGKSALSYRYLLDNYPEGCVFCVRTITSETQAQNLVSALDGLGKHNANLVIYIDVQPGETLWAFVLQELQSRGLNIPVLVSIRDEDYNATPFNGKTIQYELVELALSKEEAEHIYNSFTSKTPHPIYRTFDEAWMSFGCNGPLIEFVYLLTNNQTLAQRLKTQIDALIKEKVSDDWLELLLLVCYAGRLGANIDFHAAKKTTQCSTMQSAIQRLKDEYLIRIVDENKIEALHPVRAQIVFNEICSQTCTDEKDIVFKTIECVATKSIRVILMDYFSHQEYRLNDIQKISQNTFTDWVGFASVIKTMLWLDAKRYVDCNREYIQFLIEKKGKGWLCFLPLDFSGIYRRNELIADGIKELSLFEDKTVLKNDIDEVKNSLSSLTIDYQATDFFLKNCSQPTTLPETDQDKTSFGYALFWLAKRGFNVEMTFDETKIQKCICAGELQASSDAIRGLSEHSELSMIYQSSLNALIGRLISEMNILKFSVNEDEVICKFIPPLENEVTLPEKVKNSNQYWRIKMLDILQQLYPQKEYIDIELVGVDLLDDLGIEPLDYKLRIQKSNRHNTWVSEVNGWIKIRIDYALRPSSWEQYVLEIDQIRIEANKLIEETIKLIDDIYKKGRYTKERWKRVEDKLGFFRKYSFSENRLPVSAVDPYCLYSEGTKNIPVSDFFTMRQLLSVEKYKVFRKEFNNVYTSLDNFYNQFADVLLARIKRQDLTDIKNPRLAMSNLYTTAKALYRFQLEYDSLFSEYSCLEKLFAQQELENTLTLLNVWRNVLDAPPKGYDIAYDAKQRYRKGTTFFRNLLLKVSDATGGILLETERYVYIVSEYNADDGNTFESEYTNLVLTLREIFKSAILESSDRWYCETQSNELAYIPIISGAYSPTAFSIPFYKLLDTDASRISKPLLPCEIEASVKNELFDYAEIDIWITAMQKIQEIKLLLKRFNQIIQVEMDENCINVFELFAKDLTRKIQILWQEFAVCEELVDQLIINTDGQTFDMADTLKTFLGCRNEILEYIANRKDTTEIIQIIDNVSGIMLFLKPLPKTKHNNKT
ncbi:MAG: hypothetical protein IKK37_00360 [Clostridia bacterium]|nr:hypothetical protein [Clostridia bacterium]